MKPRPKILMIGTNQQAKGGITSVISLYRQAGLLDHKVRFLASYTDGSPMYKLLYYLAFLPQFLGTLLLEHSIQVVHVHSASYASFRRKSLLVVLSKLLNKKAIIHIHGAEFNQYYQKASPIEKIWIRQILRLCSVIIALSVKWQEDLYQICQHRDVRVIYNPTIIQASDGNGSGSSERVQFLFMGRLGKRKGVYDIIESMRFIRSKNIQIKLYGDGDLENVRAMISATGAQHRISVCGWISGEEKHEAFQQAHALLLPSYNEGLPISVLEAMAYGLPILASNVGGIPEAVKDGINGYLIAPGECQKLAQYIDALASSQQLRQQMGESSYQIARQKFSLSVIMNQLEALYDELTS